MRRKLAVKHTWYVKVQLAPERAMVCVRMQLTHRSSMPAAPTSARVSPWQSITACSIKQRNLDVSASPNVDQSETAQPMRRTLLVAALTTPATLSIVASAPVHAASDFTTLASGLKFQDNKIGEGKSPMPGDQVSVHWAGYTKNYQSKRIGNTSKLDEPYEFILGSREAIPAFEEAVATMHVGGIRRIIVPGEHPELSYPRDRSKRYDGNRYRLGPQPAEFDGQRALDFVLDNGTLDNTNRTLLFDIKLLAVRKQPGSARG